MKKIYLVVAAEQYEADELIHAYTDKEKAEKFCERCNKHQDKHPDCPDWGVHDDGPEWDDYYKKEKAWVKRHPAKGHTLPNEEFVIRDLGLVT